MPQTVLYNGALNNTPDKQGWLAYGTTLTASATQVAGTGFTNLSSLLEGKGGYSNYKPLQSAFVNSAFPTLSRSNGYSLNFQVQINSESHSSYDRAGFSLTTLSSDRLGIELGFWTNEIWAQRGGTGSTLFTHSATDRAFVSTTGMVDYSLLILGNTYYLSANNIPILQGTLQDYRAFNSSGLPYDPYEAANFFFIGDNSSNGAANSNIARLAVNTAQLGTAANNTLNGTSSDNLINGLAGNDTLNGLAGNDTLIGGDGSDRLAGGSGNDSLLGGSGNDYFVYDTNAAFTATAVGLDTLFDFSANDFIVLDKTTFTRLASTAGTGFNISSDFGFANDLAAIASSTARIVYNPTDGGLFYNENGSESGLGSGAQFATLVGAPTIAASNFVLQV
ncbi:calcium-binding protein [Trichothermofontia sp.]